MSKNFKKIANEVIDLEINALRNLKKKSINKSFDKAVESIAKCRSKVILVGVGKSGLIATKIASTLSSVGTPSFSISANDCSHGDLGAMSKKDILILISNSGNSIELKNIIQYANRYKITLICIVSKKNSLLYKNSDIRLIIPISKEAGFGLVPTASTSAQLALGDALAIAVMKFKKFSQLDFKKFHPGGNLGNKLKTVEDLMHTKKEIPFVNQNLTLKEAIKVLNKKKLGLLVVQNNKKVTTGVLTDGDLKRIFKNRIDVEKNLIKKFMSKNPIKVEKNTLAAKALNLMNEYKITSLCVFKTNDIKKTIGVIHMHDILSSKIN